MTRQEKIQQNERLRRRQEKVFRPVIKSALKRQYDGYVRELRENGAQYVLDHPNLNLVDGHFAAAMQELYKHTGIAKATLTYRTLQKLPRVEKKKGTLGFNPQWTDDILGYFRINLFNKVVLPISETTQEYIRRILDQGIAEGMSIDEMVALIERQDYLNARSERILRTEINRAINYGSELAAKSYEFKTQKRWIAAHDNRTRHAHHEADGQTVEMDGSFSVGGEQMDFPGDPNASAENTINCRCHTEIIPVRSAAGRLVPKEPQPVRIRGRLRQQLQEIIADLNN